LTQQALLAEVGIDIYSSDGVLLTFSHLYAKMPALHGAIQAAISLYAFGLLSGSDMDSSEGGFAYCAPYLRLRRFLVRAFAPGQAAIWVSAMGLGILCPIFEASLVMVWAGGQVTRAAR
jgi:hypothetical protein